MEIKIRLFPSGYKTHIVINNKKLHIRAISFLTMVFILYIFFSSLSEPLQFCIGVLLPIDSNKSLQNSQKRYVENRFHLVNDLGFSLGEVLALARVVDDVKEVIALAFVIAVELVSVVYQGQLALGLEANGPRAFGHLAFNQRQ